MEMMALKILRFIKNYCINMSVCSRASNASSQMIQELAMRSMTAKILRAEGSFNDEEMRVIWNALGLYINRNLRMGRGINIPKFGIFTFTPPEVRLAGVTNQNQRDQKPRIPVFLIQKDFVKGVPLKTAIFYHQQFGNGLRPYASVGTTGDVPIAKMNIMEIASNANMTKDQAQIGVNRIIKYVGQKLLQKQNINIEIPNVGQIIARNNLVAVKFNQFLLRDTRTVLSKSLDDRKQRGNMNLTTDNLKKFTMHNEMKTRLSLAPNSMLQIDDKTKDFLRTDFGLHFNATKNPMKNSLTQFSRTFATRQNGNTNNWLKTSQKSRISSSGLQIRNKGNSVSKEYNMALRILKEWVIQNCEDMENSFNSFAMKSGRKNQLMTVEDVWAACHKISMDINEQQSQELFRLLDANKDGFVTKDDWKKSIFFDSNKLIRDTIEIIRRRKYKATAVLQKMGIAGVSLVDSHTLKNGLKKLNQNLTDEQAIFLSRYITKGKSDVQIENILQILHLIDAGSLSIDDEWELRFLERFKKKMEERRIYEEQLENRFNFYDRQQSGFIDQINFKNVLQECGVTLNLSELSKIVRKYPINSQNKIKYGAILDALNLVTGDESHPISYSQFVAVLTEKVLRQPNFPYQLPISVRSLTSQLQATLFKDQQQSHLTQFVRKIDVNKNNQISLDDLTAYRELIKGKKDYPAQSTCPMNQEQLIIKLRQRCNKKKLSFFDLFKKLDKNHDGFITREEWMSNLDWIMPTSEDDKQLLFDFMDSSHLQMIDYKTFLQKINGNAGSDQNQKFDWVEECLVSIKNWFAGSGIMASKAFKLVDADGDSYINEKDLSNFLQAKLRYHERQLSIVRLMKVLKLLDTHKRGKVDETDWEHFINSQKIDWVAGAKQQIGIILSKQYSSLNDAFYQITQGDSRLVFATFKEWAEKKKVFSGFVSNESILKQFFSSIDTHKKGYISEQDFISTFGSYNWKSEQTKQFLQKIRSKFSSADEVFKMMNSYSKSDLNFERFCQFIGQLFGARFKRTDIKNIWGNLVGNERSISGNQFIKRFGKEWQSTDQSINKQFPQDSWKYEDFSVIKGTTMRSFEHSYNETESMEMQVRKVVKSIKELLAASPKSLEQAFTQVDSEKTGKLNNIQFKKAIRFLNIALTSKELDLLLNYCDYKVDTLINWREFMKRFEPNADEKKIISRIGPKMQLLSDLLHYYMISPKDAFTKWNNPRTGFMNFEEFLKMLRQLYHKAGQSLPEIAILKEFFELIDVRRDSQLDYQEFTQTFRNYKPPSLVMGTITANNNLVSRPTSSPHGNKPIRETEVPEFKNSPHYEQFVRFVSRNRKYLQEKIEGELGNSDRLVSYEGVSKIIREAGAKNKIKFSNSVIRHCVAFSMTGDKVDYRLMLESCKERGDAIVEFPLKQVF